ncbi:MAG: hypothetical protein J6J36_03045 [Clostridia bacterium]|nr:hypothetical protein [Clostridia bacterium]
MSNLYLELKNKQQTEFNSFPIKFAFSREQEEKGLEELGLASANEAIGIGGGGFIRESDKQAFYDMLERLDKEHTQMLENPKYVVDMFKYELANHEYGYTYDLEPTLEACGLTEEDIENNLVLKKGLAVALEEYENYEEEI